MNYHTETAGDLIIPYLASIRVSLNAGGNPDAIARDLKLHSESFARVTEEEIALAIRCAVKRG